MGVASANEAEFLDAGGIEGGGLNGCSGRDGRDDYKGEDEEDVGDDDEDNYPHGGTSDT